MSSKKKRRREEFLKRDAKRKVEQDRKRRIKEIEHISLDPSPWPVVEDGTLEEFAEAFGIPLYMIK